MYWLIFGAVQEAHRMMSVHLLESQFWEAALVFQLVDFTSLSHRGRAAASNSCFKINPK